MRADKGDERRAQAGTQIKNRTVEGEEGRRKGEGEKVKGKLGIKIQR